jgi:D-alanine-D-alanine ligase
MSKKITVALIFGGRSAEHEVSLISASAVHRNLDRSKFEVRSIYITKNGLWKAVAAPSTDPKTLARGRAFSFLPWEVRGLASKIPADIYFPVLHGPYGEDGTIQGLLEMAGVPYVGAGVLGSALGMDKATAKSLLREQGLPVVPWLVIRESEWRDGRAGILRRIRRDFALPIFVKPSNLGSSVGITKIKDARQTEEAIETAFQYDTKILVEKGIQGREIECSVLGNDSPEASLPGEVIPFREFYDYNDKYIEGKTGFVIPARLPRGMTGRIRRIAVEAFKALDGTGMARVDFFIEDGTDSLFLNEVNTIPGFTEISMYPKLWEASGLPFPRLVERLVELGLERHKARKACVDRGLR